MAQDAKGNEYEIYEFTEMITPEGDCSGDTPSPIPGYKSFKTANGQTVKRTKKGEYEILGIVPIPITSDDPNAS